MRVSLSLLLLSVLVPSLHGTQAKAVGDHDQIWSSRLMYTQSLGDDACAARQRVRVLMD